MRTRDRSGALRVGLTTLPYSRLVDIFCREYKTAFVLASERETRAGLRLCLSLNGPRGAPLHARYGASREHIAVLRDAGGAVAAGMNFICFPMPEAGGVTTVHTTYVFVAPAWRGHGLLRDVYQTIEDVARAYATESGMPDDAPIVFVGEQKDPFKMTVASFRAGVDADGQDAFDRLAMWSQLGARVLLFCYVLPPLIMGGPADPTLFLRVLSREDIGDAAPGPAAPAVDPAMLKEHLRRFFAISVAKGQYDPDGLPEVRRQMEELEALLARKAGVPALGMPSAAKLADWKRAALEALGTGIHPADMMIGALLGIASVPEASATVPAVTPAPRR